MDTLICNKCFAPTCRGRHPYNITQCAHVYCQNCVKQVEEQCLQCGYNRPAFLPLKEPLAPKVAPWFQPLSNTFELLLRVETFKIDQMKITIQRFHDLDKKYEVLKSQYFALQRYAKGLTDKYTNIKSEREMLNKRLVYFEMLQNTPRSNIAKTPTDSGIFTHPSSTKYSVESLEFLKPTDVIPTRSTESVNQHKTSDGFIIPNNLKIPRSRWLTSYNGLEL